MFCCLSSAFEHCYAVQNRTGCYESEKVHRVLLYRSSLILFASTTVRKGCLIYWDAYEIAILFQFKRLIFGNMIICSDNFWTFMLNSTRPLAIYIPNPMDDVCIFHKFNAPNLYKPLREKFSNASLTISVVHRVQRICSREFRNNFGTIQFSWLNFLCYTKTLWQ